jgi:hypothetical protein
VTVPDLVLEAFYTGIAYGLAAGALLGALPGFVVCVVGCRKIVKEAR